MAIDLVWLVFAAGIAASLTIAYCLGVEVGRDRERRERAARDRHPVNRSRKKES